MSAPSSAVIIGATGILGAAITQHLSDRGGMGHLTLVGRSAHKLDSLAAMISGADCTVETVAADLTGTDLNRLSRAVESRAPDCLVITMGDHARTPLGTARDRHEEILFANLTAPLLAIHAIAPLMRPGTITLFGDAMISRPMTGYSTYYAAKAGITTLVETLAHELAPLIRINALLPGILNVKASAGPDAEARWAARVPLGYLGGVGPLLKALDHLLDNPYLTGALLPVDGGASHTPGA